MTALPKEFASAQTSGCGVVAFWTRDPVGRRLAWTRFALSVAAIAAFAIASMKIEL